MYFPLRRLPTVRLDEFTFEVDRAEWLFTLALGLGLGLAIAAAVMALVSPRRHRPTMAVFALCGLAISAFTGSLAVDAGPWPLLDILLKPYFSTVAFTAAMVGALLLGAAISMAVALAIYWAVTRRSLPWLLAPAGALAVVALLLGALLPVIDRAAGGTRHPTGTLTSSTVTFESIYSGLEIPTGLDIAGNGDILVVELTGRRILVLRPAGDRFEATEFPLQLLERSQAFHGVFHPRYPDAPFAYLTVEHALPDQQSMRILRANLQTGDFEILVEDLPTTRGGQGNHYGSGMAFCGQHLFVGTSDTDSTIGRVTPGSRRFLERARAQSPTSPAGKILRWELSGIHLVPAGVFGSTFPSFAMGFRNPFAVGCDQPTGLAWVADNGERAHDQLRLAEPGSNHGWPTTHERLIFPPWFDFGDASIAPTGVALRPGDSDRLVIAAFNSQALYELTLDRDARKAASVRLLAEVDGGAFSLAIGADGCVYFTDVESVKRLQEPGCE